MTFTRCTSHLGELHCERFQGHTGPNHSTWDDDLGCEISWFSDDGDVDDAIAVPLWDGDDYESEDLDEILRKQPFASAVGRA